MSKRAPHQPRPTTGRQYQLRVEGRLEAEWSEWFEGLTITPAADGDTLLTGWVADQAALHGLLKKVRDLGLPLLSVNPLDPGGAPAAREPSPKE